MRIECEHAKDAMQLCLPSAVHSQLQFALKTASVMQANHRQEPSQMQILKDFS